MLFQKGGVLLFILFNFIINICNYFIYPSSATAHISISWAKVNLTGALLSRGKAAHSRATRALSGKKLAIVCQVKFD